MREKNGYAVIELTHDGIPSAELKPEAFNDIQLQVLNGIAKCRRSSAAESLSLSWTWLPVRKFASLINAIVYPLSTK